MPSLCIPHGQLAGAKYHGCSHGRVGGTSSASLCTVRRLGHAAPRVEPSWSGNSVRTGAASTGTSVVTEEEELLYEGESFYDLLGVSPTADKRTIKAAYIRLMKESHPDKTSMDEEMNAFCALINDVYETLSDPVRRAAYDAMVGFSPDAINPFNDPTQERDQVFVDESACIGCTNCATVCPKTFAMEPEHGRARVHSQNPDLVETQQEAMDTCPVSCIHWVSRAQLSLLEAAMARMERVAVWSMMMSGRGSNVDVFYEASLAWQKRQSALVRRRAEMRTPARSPSPAAPSPWSSFWNNVVNFEGAAGSSMYESPDEVRRRAQRNASWNDSYASSSSSDDEANTEPLTDKDARRIADLAARAARASRTWKTWQQAAARQRQALAIPAVSSASSVDDI